MCKESFCSSLEIINKILLEMRHMNSNNNTGIKKIIFDNDNVISQCCIINYTDLCDAVDLMDIYIIRMIKYALLSPSLYNCHSNHK